MAHIRQFSAIRFAKHEGNDVSALIAPPFDVLDAAGKAALQAKHPNNIVSIDLPHIPPKAAGPATVYEQANITLRAWLSAGILARDPRPGLYPYAQSFEVHGRTIHRRGFFALVRLTPFDTGQVVPHEKTYAGAIEDRLSLMRATATQLSPIFGLYSDPRKEIAGLLYRDLSRPEMTGTLDGVRHDLWTVHDSSVEAQVIDLMGPRPIYIADGHHRYTTALQYQREAEQAYGRLLPPNHPANFCLFVLVGMQDDGLLILPTHRLIGNLEGFHIESFLAAAGANIEATATTVAPNLLAEYAQETLPRQPQHTMGLYDAQSRKLWQLQIKNLDVLRALEPKQSDAWRQLDVAILQRYLLDEVIAPTFARGREITKNYTADAAEILPRMQATGSQIAFILQSTPLHALEELGKHNEVMPQKSTYFYPKLATGLVLNPLAER